MEQVSKTEKRSTGVIVIQILLASIGYIAFLILLYFFLPTIKVLTADGDADLGEVIATVLLFLPLFIIFTPVCCTLGGIITTVAAIQRKKIATKDAFSLTMVILGIILMIVPAAMLALVFVASAAKA